MHSRNFNNFGIGVSLKATHRMTANAKANANVKNEKTRPLY